MPTEERRTQNRRASDVDCRELQSRISVLETKMESMTTQVSKHEMDSKEVWVQISKTLNDIKEEITNFKFAKLQDNRDLEGEIRELHDKIVVIETTAKTSYKIAGLVGTVIGVLISVAFKAIDLFK